MEDPFAFLTLDFLKRSEIYPGSLGTFRYRFQRTGKVNDGTVQAWVYENICFEKAQQIETETVPWTEEGMASLRAWRNEKLREWGSEPYRIWMALEAAPSGPAFGKKSPRRHIRP